MVNLYEWYIALHAGWLRSRRHGGKGAQGHDKTTILKNFGQCSPHSDAVTGCEVNKRGMRLEDFESLLLRDVGDFLR